MVFSQQDSQQSPPTSTNLEELNEDPESLNIC